MFKKMKKILLLSGLLIGLMGNLAAQMSSSQPFDKTIALGLKGGINMPRMWYFNNAAMSQLPQKDTLTIMGGIFADIPLSEGISFAPEVVYVQRGTDMRYVHRTGAQVHYSIKVAYADLRLPVEFYWPIKPYFQPYLVAGAEAGFRLFGEIHMDRTAPIVLNETLPADSSNMFLVHAGAFAGAGVRSRITLGAMEVMLKLSATFHQGFVDSYSPYEKNGTAQAQNVNAYQIKGWRLPQGLELTLGVAIPLKPILKDACASFSNDRRRHGNRGHLYGY
jgi:hypothetical protein